MVGRVGVVVVLLVVAGWIFYRMIYPYLKTRRKMKMSEALSSCRRVGHRLKGVRPGEQRVRRAPSRAPEGVMSTPISVTEGLPPKPTWSWGADTVMESFTRTTGADEILFQFQNTLAKT
jgi:hypothetical protein